MSKKLVIVKIDDMIEDIFTNVDDLEVDVIEFEDKTDLRILKGLKRV